MKRKWLDLDWPRRVMIFIQAFLVLLFLILYLTVGRQQVILYRDEMLRRHVSGEVTTYSGTINSEEAVFTVTGTTVEYRLGGTQYGPYRILSAPDAVPAPSPKLYSSETLKGVEIQENGAVLFRGAYQSSGSFYVVDAQGETFFGDERLFGLISSDYSGDVYGYSYDPEPGAYSILKIAAEAGVARRGSFGIFLLGALLCVINTVSILFADALFRWNLRFSIRNVENAEPSEWALFSRWVSWLVITVCALVVLIRGLSMGV